LFWPSDYGVHFAGEVLVVRNSLLQENPELVRNIVEAQIDGWNNTLSNPEQAISYVMKYAKQKDADLQREMLRRILPLVHPGNVKVGTINLNVLEEMNGILLRYGLLKSEDLVEKSFSLEYVKVAKSE
jgi:NitT/TauT family transport system substrate-binding protein